MNWLQAYGLVGHEWKEDRLPYFGSAAVAVNAASHLWRVSPGSDAESTRVASSQFVWPLFGSTSLDPKLDASGAGPSGGDSYSVLLLTRGPQVQGFYPRHWLCTKVDCTSVFVFNPFFSFMIQIFSCQWYNTWPTIYHRWNRPTNHIR
jgi:hypothetical protein